ncbi:glycine cleavage system protein GcvH [Rhodopirellula baltica]|uniref:Glycine cleavage system H protein n=1 Tax=Rhodopirellula baltica (strain DSM 10527 / NCIMB 13988 / SH1) TaxID=243090 RepID=GCSH_RHOBA|nr:glycine cleavage system protein GcvH [Rhodopirellula baltica]Q7UNG9.1 RecName: Full=Glycine cleavage system H protein [Rhodopirellula baltica SH 1]CAD75450.1 probable probably glycine cleavage system H protein [Rhodopirellula baltica SH 1]HBE65693.1 glycine cleavage system protein H [Rhodopirellula baltica]
MARDPSTLRYAETHEWVDVQEEGGDKFATIGISAFAVEQLNDLVYMDLPEVGRTLEVGEEFGEVESVKAVSPLYSPVAGEVVAVHTDLPDNLDNLNDDAFDFGWILKVKLSADLPETLMDFAAYQKQCSEAG